MNAQHIKAVPGRKTDQKDSEWIAGLTAARTAARKFCASPTDARTARSHPVSGEFDAGDQPHRQSRSEGSGGCQHQAGLGSNGRSGRVGESDAGSDARGRARLNAARDKLADAQRVILSNRA